MAPTKEMIEKAIDKLESLELVFFNATPKTIQPGQASTLTWKVKASKPQTGAGVQYLINGIRVKGNSLAVSPLVNTVYTLTAKSLGMSVSLGSVGIIIDTTGCIVGLKPEAELRTEVANTLSAFVKQQNVPLFIDSEQPLSLEVDFSGINIAVHLGLKGLLPFDILIKISMRITLAVQNGEPKVSCVQFNTSVDYPGFLDFLIPQQVQDNVDNLITTLLEGSMKDTVVDKIKNKIDSDPAFQFAKAAGYHLVVLRTVPDAINYMVCRENS